MRNNDLRTELEYFSEDYDEEREMEPRPELVRAATPPLQAASPRVRKRRERVVGFEETKNRGESMVERNNEGGRAKGKASRVNEVKTCKPFPPLLAPHREKRRMCNLCTSFMTSITEVRHFRLTKEGISLLTVCSYHIMLNLSYPQT
ncbi:hypothetical protein Tco_0613431 [Tanacetum coccineum]